MYSISLRRSCWPGIPTSLTCSTHYFHKMTAQAPFASNSLGAGMTPCRNLLSMKGLPGLIRLPWAILCRPVLQAGDLDAASGNPHVCSANKAHAVMTHGFCPYKGNLRLVSNAINFRYATWRMSIIRAHHPVLEFVVSNPRSPQLCQSHSACM